MWRVDNCFIHGFVVCYWMCRSDVSVIPFRICLFFQLQLLALSLWIFDLSDDKLNYHFVIGLR